MSKKLILTVFALLLSMALFAQPSGGVKGTVVNRAGRTPIADAQIALMPYGSEDVVAEGKSAADGKFLFTGLEDGIYKMVVRAAGYSESTVNVTVEGHIKDMMFVSLVAVAQINEVSDESFAEFDMDDSGYNDTPTILFGSNDPYSSIVSFGFSSIRFKNRGYSNESQDVYLSGIKMNDAITGYSPYSLWSGLNEAMRSKDTFIGNESSPYGLGSYNGLTNISGQPEDVRTGWRFSLLSNSALYRLRVMASYASGELDNGWSYAFNVSARLGGNDYVKGVYYRSFAYYAAVSKKFNDQHKLSLVAFGTPGNRGAQNASTQEVYDLMGDNMYNSNWGYQAGKVRNARVRKTHEPVFILKYTANPTSDLETSATVLYRTGFNGYTALDWYDASDPRPDYYRNLPSYFWHENEDYGRFNEDKWAWATEAWSSHDKNLTHINWDRMYNVNYNSVDDRYDSERHRSKYAQEERRVDQHDVNLAWNIDWRATNFLTVQGGLNYKWNRTEHYKKMADLLGGDYYVDMDQFAERDFSQTPEMFQNDLDYYLEHGQARMIGKGDKYGYDYYAHIQNANAWANLNFNYMGLSAVLSGRVGYAGFYREGLVRKGLFPGLDPDGEPYYTSTGEMLTTYDADGEVMTSLGKAKKNHFLEYAVKANLEYAFQGGHRVYATFGYFQDAPKFNQSYVSARTRNSLVPNLTPTHTLSTDLNYQYSNAGYNVRLTGFYTTIKDQTKVMSFYDDTEKSFVNFAMSGMDQRHVGLELGFQLPLGVEGLSLVGAVSYGDYVYTSTPRMTMTVDNSSKIVRNNEPVEFWKGHYTYKKDADGNFLKDDDGNYIADKYIRHRVASTPQLATDLGLKLFLKSYWFFEVHGQFFANSYLDMNPMFRTEDIVYGAGPEYTTPADWEDMASQEKFKNAFLLNVSIGKSWYINRKYNIGFSLQGNNLTHRLAVKTGGYEQTRLITGQAGTRYYRFDPKYFYMPGANYMLNIYFRF
ncbi:MAG: TonB-dependent receptor domain-containing protein [Candidatus Cryptobacteroides sp.]